MTTFVRLLPMWALVALIASATSAGAQKVVRLSSVADFNINDASRAFQRALGDASIDVLVVDGDRGQVITSGPIYTRRSNLTLRFERGVTLKGKAKAFDTYESLFSFDQSSGITIEGNGATIEMNKFEYNRESQFRHCILLGAVRNVVIQDLTLKNAPGDGILMQPTFVNGAPTGNCVDVTVRRVKMIGNNRQGASLTAAKNVTFLDCEFKDTQGALPESGLSIEPFRSNQLMENVQIKGCTFSGNTGSGIEYISVDQTSSSPPISVTVDDCDFTNNVTRPGGGSAAIRVENGTNAPGTFTVLNSRIFNERQGGIIVRQFAPGVTTRFANVTLTNTAYAPKNSAVGAVNVWPVTFGKPSERAFGNARFENVRISNPDNRMQVNIPTGPGYNTRVASVSGDICVSQPGSIKADLGAGIPGNALAVRACPTTTPTGGTNGGGGGGNTVVEVRARTPYGGSGAECAVVGMANANHRGKNNALAERRFTTTSQWATYTVTLPGTFSANQLRLWFTNNRDDVTPNRDLDIDWIRVGGKQYESESRDTYSTGTYTSYDRCAPGFKWSGRLNCAGYLHFATRGGNIGDVDGRSAGNAVDFDAVTVFPNPAQSNGTLVLGGLGDLSAEGPGETLDVSITDAQGRIVQTRAFSAGDRVELPLTQVPAGVYQVVATSSAGGSAAKRFVVQ